MTHDDTPQLVDIEQICGGWIKKYVLTYRLSDGRVITYDAASRKEPEAFRAGLEANARGEVPAADAVCIVGRTAADELLLIREFRYPLNGWCVAFPAGLVDAGEDIAAAVDRELREETGYALRRDLECPLTVLPQPGFSSTGLSDETVHVVYAEVKKAGDAQPEPTELIEPFLLPIASISDFLAACDELIGTRAQLILEGFARTV